MKKFYLIASLIIIVQACSKSGGQKNTPVDCNTVAKSFITDVNPIIQTYCNVPACHASGSVNGPGPLTNHTQVFSARFQIRAAIHSGLMPQNTTLTGSQKNTIICWIDGGAANN
jgi:hypothetical protein